MQRALYLLIYPLIWLISKLPFWLLYCFSSLLYLFIYKIIGYRKKVVKNNLRLVFPKKSESEINSIARNFYKHLCDIIFETLKSLTLPEKELNKRFTYNNIEIIQDLYHKNKSVLLVCGHYGSWEWSNIITKYTKHKPFAVYKKIDNPYFDQLVRKIRGKYGGSIVTNKNIGRALYKSYKNNEKSITLILADQTPKVGVSKYQDTFLDIKVPMFTGVEELAKLLDFAVVFQKVKKVKRGYYEATFETLTDTPKNLEDYKITRAFFNTLETQIKEEPAYYLWSHKRWKHRIID